MYCKFECTFDAHPTSYTNPAGRLTDVIERKYFSCPSQESNQGRRIYRQTLYHVPVKADFYHNAVEVYLYTSQKF